MRLYPVFKDAHIILLRVLDPTDPGRVQKTRHRPRGTELFFIFKSAVGIKTHNLGEEVWEATFRGSGGGKKLCLLGMVT